jgi:hypothetical protein
MISKSDITRLPVMKVFNDGSVGKLRFSISSLEASGVVLPAEVEGVGVLQIKNGVLEIREEINRGRERQG